MFEAARGGGLVEKRDDLRKLSYVFRELKLDQLVLIEANPDEIFE